MERLTWRANVGERGVRASTGESESEYWGERKWESEVGKANVGEGTWESECGRANVGERTWENVGERTMESESGIANLSFEESQPPAAAQDTGYAAGRGIKLLPLASLDFFTSFEGEGIRGKDDSILQHRGYHTTLSRAMLVDAFDVRC